MLYVIREIYHTYLGAVYMLSGYHLSIWLSKFAALAFRQVQKTGYIKSDASNDQYTNKKPR